jgi:uroporphyrin-III C-methyltransferase
MWTMEDGNRFSGPFWTALPALEPGWVWLVGGGPGDPGLITALGLKALAGADVILHDALIDPRLLALARPGADLVFAGKRAGVRSCKQDEISDMLVREAKAGRRVLRLKGGDPFVFGRGGEEAQALARAGIPFRIVPGISAGIGGLAYAGIPVTHRDINQSVTFVTGHDQSGQTPGSLDWQAISDGAPVLVIYMGMKHAGRIAEALIAAGRPPAEPVAVVSQATLPDERVLETTLGRLAADLAASGLQPPAVLCVGRAVLMRQALDWQALARGEAPRSLDPLGRDRDSA